MSDSDPANKKTKQFSPTHNSPSWLLFSTVHPPLRLYSPMPHPPFWLLKPTPHSTSWLLPSRPIHIHGFLTSRPIHLPGFSPHPPSWLHPDAPSTFLAPLSKAPSTFLASSPTPHPPSWLCPPRPIHLTGCISSNRCRTHSYLLYTSELPKAPNVAIGTFADDTAILICHTDVLRAFSCLQGYLNTFQSWLQTWKIKINESKSTYLTFKLQNDSSPQIYLNKVEIPPVTTVKHLG